MGRLSPVTKSGAGSALVALGAGADLGLLLVVGGSARIVVLVGFQAAILGGFVLVIWARIDKERELALAAQADAEHARAAHHQDLIDYARSMKVLLGQRETPWYSSTPVYGYFRQHFPDLIEPVNTWLMLVRAEQGPYFAPDRRLTQTRAQAELGLRSVYSRNIRGSCDRCKEIESELSRATRRSRLMSILDRLYRRPTPES